MTNALTLLATERFLCNDPNLSIKTNWRNYIKLSVFEMWFQLGRPARLMETDLNNKKKRNSKIILEKDRLFYFAKYQKWYLVSM